MAISISLGIIVGIIGFLPFLIALKLSRRAVATNTTINVLIMLLSIFISLGFYIASILIFNDCDHDHILPFVISVALCLIITTISFAIYMQIKH